ncbi:tetratricopeptide repeat protein [Kitasatospora sp. NPDC004799]|uniref:tetratricopeptide repeat protein n=1 Tax=Kitasatospora sp. NPDC004799 TaxID=3154460 RepID=UPI0033B5980A
MPAPSAGVPGSAGSAGSPPVPGGPVSLVKPGVPPTPPRPARPVSLVKAGGTAEAPGVTLRKSVPADAVPGDSTPPAGVTLLKSRPEPADDVVAEPELPVAAAAVAAEAEADADSVTAGAVAEEAVEAVTEEPGEETGEDVPGEAVEETPEAVDEPEVAEEPGDAVPAEPAQTDEVPIEGTPAGESPADEALTGEALAEGESADAVPADEAPAGEEPSAAVPQDEVPADEADDAAAAGRPRADYREVIGRIVRSADAGDHAAATDLAFALELEAIAEHGAVSEPVLQVRQVRAHVCRLAGRSAEAADIYREVALTLLRSQGPDHPETQRAATNAEACWRAIGDRAEAIRIAPEIIELRAYLPGPDGRKLRAAERYLAQLAATS